MYLLSETIVVLDILAQTVVMVLWRVQVLSWRGRRAAGVRHRQTSDVWKRGAMAERAARSCRQQHRHHAGGE